jgi:hypothetical protein
VLVNSTRKGIELTSPDQDRCDTQAVTIVRNHATA